MFWSGMGIGGVDTGLMAKGKRRLFAACTVSMYAVFNVGGAKTMQWQMPREWT